MDFDNYGFHPSIAAGVRTLGYSKPKPIQAQVIPAILTRRDVICLAKPGTGKTEAFVLPVLQRLQAGSRGYIRALVMTPTREQAIKICEVFDHLGHRTDLRCVAVYSGTGMLHQKKELHRGVEIVVACPDQLLKFLWRGIVSLTDLEIMVIDEADGMIDAGLLPDINNILACIMNKQQTVVFSATMPKKIEYLTRKILNDPVIIQMEGQIPVKPISLQPQDLKTKLLLEILKKDETDSVMVFTANQQSAERMAHQILKAGYRVTLLQGNLAQNRRQAEPEKTHDDSLKILVATDVAARGINVSRITSIIRRDATGKANTDKHDNRTGQAGKTDDAFVVDADAEKIRALEKMLAAPIQRMTR
jgi:ATP-dependent RNA helicase RhlE